jgi:hypothetical protein
VKKLVITIFTIAGALLGGPGCIGIIEWGDREHVFEPHAFSGGGEMPE